MESPFFTVVIPTHNRSNLLKRAIKSVLNQNFEDFELIIVDDHSMDNTSSVVSSFSDDRIQYLINHRTKGACGARNVGIFSAKGRWVAFLDDDDEWLPDKLKSQHESIIKADRIVGMICTDYAIYKGNGQEPMLIRYRPSGWIRDKLLYGHTMGTLSSTCIRTDILLSIKGFDERFKSSQDWDLWLRTAEVCQVTNIPKILVKQHQEIRPDRIGQNSKAKLEGHILLREKYSDFINQSLRLRHRHDSFIFTFAILEENKALVFRCMPWVMLGAFIDLPNFLRTVRTIVLLANRKRAQTRHSKQS